MSLTSYRAAPPRAKSVQLVLSRLRDCLKRKGRFDCGPEVSALADGVLRRFVSAVDADNIAFSRPGSDLLSRVLRRSTIGAGAFHGRVRNGNGCSHPAMTTRSAKGNVVEKLAQALACFLCFEHVFCF